MTLGDYERELDKPGHVPGEYQQRSDPLAWRIWWRVVWPPVIRLVNLVPTAEWRREQWLWRIDIWAMDHIGTIGRTKP